MYVSSTIPNPKARVPTSKEINDLAFQAKIINRLNSLLTINYPLTHKCLYKSVVTQSLLIGAGLHCWPFIPYMQIVEITGYLPMAGLQCLTISCPRGMNIIILHYVHKITLIRV